jgi:YD repeat-containing protein
MNFSSSIWYYAGFGGSQCATPITAIITLRRDRDAKCLANYQSRTNAAGEMECVQVAASSCPSFGNPICAADGAKRQVEFDFRQGGLGGLEFARYFYSPGYYYRTIATTTKTSYANYWRHTYDRLVIEAEPNPYTLASAQRPDGTVIDFDLNGRALQNYQGGAETLTALTVNGVAQGWKLTLADDSVELYDRAGKLQSITTRAGLSTTLAYDAMGYLSTVTDPFGRRLTLTYDDRHRLATLTDPAGPVYTYRHDADDHWLSVTYPDQRTRTYLYENTLHPALLTGIVDENGQRFATFAYDNQGRGISTQHAGGANSHQLSYHASWRRIVTDPLGTQRDYWFTNANGVLKIGTTTQPGAISGTATSTSTYDVHGNLASRTDFNGHQTTFVYDPARNLETSRTEGLTATGAPTAATRTITTEWHGTRSGCRRGSPSPRGSRGWTGSPTSPTTPKAT